MQNAADGILLLEKHEQAAFKVLYDRYWGALYGQALSRLGNDADAQDAVQEVFISCWRNKQTIAVETTLAPYLHTALKYCIIKKVYRSSKAGQTIPLSTDLLAQTTLSSDELVQYKELEQIIGDEVLRLPEKMREIYSLSRIEQLPISKIAIKLQVSEQTVKNTLTTALSRLRKNLAHYNNLILLLL